MTAPLIEQLVVDYIARLERAASTLPPGDRADLIEEIREHIDTAKEVRRALYSLIDRRFRRHVTVSARDGA